MTFLLNLITAAVLYGTPLLYGTSGEILTEKSGNLNLKSRAASAPARKEASRA